MESDVETLFRRDNYSSDMYPLANDAALLLPAGIRLLVPDLIHSPINCIMRKDHVGEVR